MGFLLLMLLLITIVNIVEHAARSKKQVAKRDGNVIVEEVAKCCPPHRWQYLEVRDTEGKTVRWKLECEICGPLKPSDGPARVI